MPNIHLLLPGARKLCMPYRENVYENMSVCVCISGHANSTITHTKGSVNYMCLICQQCVAIKVPLNRNTSNKTSC